MLRNRASNPVRHTINDEPGFQSINRGYDSVFRPNHLSLGLDRTARGWMDNPRGMAAQARIINEWRTRVEAVGDPTKPAVQSLYVDLTKDPQTPPQSIHLGFRLGTNHRLAYQKSLEEIGLNHVALNLRLNQADTEETMKRLAEDILPEFSRPDFTE